MAAIFVDYHQYGFQRGWAAVVISGGTSIGKVREFNALFFTLSFPVLVPPCRKMR
ncbi:hypothetical protein [Teredinibacter purpureus]|jgi:hypothetical protein|uniref:hypothetical protein n=1 Tax=Teredinibacter purpureus TaxID=2731756 RepID=UPI0013C3F827|nr:hypothetical protein [Teredinibacter purpureus]